MSDLESTAAGTLFRRIYIGVPAMELWEWIVEPERVERYHLSRLAARPEAPGDEIAYLNRLHGMPLATGVVETLLPGRRLVHSFQFNRDDPEPPSTVSYELVPYGERMCCLEVRHEGLDPSGEEIATAASGWDVTLSSLKTIAETGEPLPWPRRRR